MSPSTFYLYTETTPERRKYYLDELFNRSTPPPEWAAVKTKPTIIFKDTIQTASSLWKFVNARATLSMVNFRRLSIFRKEQVCA